MFTLYMIDTYTKLVRIGTQQYSPYMFDPFRTVFSPQIIITTKDIYKKKNSFQKERSRT